ncbi:MAG: hypothetical protein ACFCUQ_15565 [Kiloniellales bacterium]
MLTPFLLGVAGALALASAPAAHADRAEMYLFKYNGVRSEADQQAFDEFTEIVTTKLSRLADEVTQPDQDESPASHLSVILVIDPQTREHLPFRQSNSDLHLYWQRQAALAVLSGRVRKDQGIYSVLSRVYVGDLRGELESSFIEIALPIASEQYDTTRDSHSIVTLYALAMDIVERCGPLHEAIHLFGEAKLRLQDVVAAAPQMEMLHEPIEAGLRRAQQSCGGQ